MTQLTGPPLNQTEVERALGRIGIPHRDPFCWEALNWFVVFTQRKLDSATDGDWLSLNEEVQALLNLIAHQQLAIPFSRDELSALREKSLEWLDLLVGTGAAVMGPFPVQVYICRGRPSTGIPRVRRLGDLMVFPTTKFAGHIPPGGMVGMKYYFASLLERWPDTVQRCPRCLRLFARFREHAEFCGRECQSREAAKNTRQKKKELLEGEVQQQTAKNKERTGKIKKGGRHGKS